MHRHDRSIRIRGRSAGAADMLRVLLLAAAALACALPEMALAQPVGDFGRVKPGVVSDVILPALKRGSARKQGRLTSDFALTDEEGEMHDRIFRFTVAPHARFWFDPYGKDVLPPPPGKQAKPPAEYYGWLRKTDFASSHVRFVTIANDVALDVDTLPETFRAICVVLEIDRRRAIAVAEIDGLDARTWQEADARLAENRHAIDTFVLSLDYRYRNYDYALDHFIVETPHNEAVLADAALTGMEIWVDRAMRRDFCIDSWDGGYGDADIIRPRVLMGAPDEGEYRK